MIYTLHKDFFKTYSDTASDDNTITEI